MRHCKYCGKKIKVIHFVDTFGPFDSKNCIIDYFRTYPERVTKAVKVYFDENKLKLKAN